MIEFMDESQVWMINRVLNITQTSTKSILVSVSVIVVIVVFGSKRLCVWCYQITLIYTCEIWIKDDLRCNAISNHTVLTRFTATIEKQIMNNQSPKRAVWLTEIHLKLFLLLI